VNMMFRPPPRPDASNRILVIWLKIVLDGEYANDDGCRNWTWQEVVDEMGWSGEWLRGCRRLAKDLGLLK
jgi:hypothetical protein